MRAVRLLALLLVAGCSFAVPLNHKLVGFDHPPDQCSRATVERGDSYFEPEMPQIEKFEALAEAGLRTGGLYGGAPYFAWFAHEDQDGSTLSIQSDWDRYYVGIERDGRRFIYGGFVPDFEPGPGAIFPAVWDPVMCDGGPKFFGLEINVGSEEIVAIGFNGIG